MISVPIRIWSISMVVFALCNGQLLFWGCVDNNCYADSFSYMNQSDAKKYCEEHNLTFGILLPQNYEQVKYFVSPSRPTWIGIRRYAQEQWTYLSRKSGPVVNSTHRAQQGEVVCAYQHISQVYTDACYMKKKYVCQNVTGQTNGNSSVHHTPLSWFEARNDCIRQGGDLYDPNVYGWKYFGDEQYWVGVRKDLWTWTASGKEVDVTYWDPSQPQGNGSCVTITRDRWYLLDCQEDRAKALCVNQSAPVLDARSSSSSSSSSTSSSSSPSSLPTTPSSISEETFAATRSPLVPSASLRPPENINPLTDSDAFPQSTLQQNELPSMHTTHSPKDADSNSDDENKIKDKAVVNPVSRSDSNTGTGKYIGGGVAGAVAVLVIGLGIGFALGRFRKKEKTETQSSQEVSDNHPRDDQYEEINESALEMNEFAQAEACGPKYVNCQTNAYSALNDEAEPENPYFPLRKP